jgi:DNA mismatch endonuclease, patch repair protein
VPTKKQSLRPGLSVSFSGFTSASAKASRLARATSKSHSTGPELRLRRALRGLGLARRFNYSSLPGKPDVVFPRKRLAVFCDGDFWHGRNRRELARLSTGHNAKYWVAKIRRNRERDRRHNKDLARLGWTVLRYWESDIRKDADKIAREIIATAAKLPDCGPTALKVRKPGKKGKMSKV